MGKYKVKVKKALGYFLVTYFKFYLNLKVHGMENLPEAGSFVLAANHISYLDPVVILSALLSKREIAPIATKGLFVPPLSWFLNLVDAVPLDRSANFYKDILSKLVSIIKERPVLIFPEGGIKRYPLSKPKAGLIFLSKKAEVPIVPAHVIGTDDALPTGSFWIKKVSVSLKIGKPFYLDAIPASDRNQSTLIMEKIYQL